MSTFKCIIVDDDYGSVLVIEKFLNNLKEFEIIGKYTDALEAYDEINKKQPDLIFLDVEMPHLSGIELIKLISSQRKIILTTASQKYAVTGFDLDIVDYLMKPLSFDRFLKAISKFNKLIENNGQPDQNRESEKFIYVKENYKTIRITIDEIMYIESLKEYVHIYTKEKTIRTRQSLKFFEDVLEQHSFIRIHKSFLVAINKINAYTKSTVEINNKMLPIGRSYKNKILL